MTPYTNLVTNCTEQVEGIEGRRAGSPLKSDYKNRHMALWDPDRSKTDERWIGKMLPHLMLSEGEERFGNVLKSLV